MLDLNIKIFLLKKLINQIFGNQVFAASSITTFPLVIDNFAFYQPIETLVKKGAFKKCKIINGFNKDEMGLFAVGFGLLGQNPMQWDQTAQTMNLTTLIYNVDNFFYFFPSFPQTLTQNMSDAIINKYVSMNLTAPGYYKYLDAIGTDYIFACPSFQMSELYSMSKSDVYFYQYDFRISTTVYPDSVGVVHTDELPLVFDEPESNKVMNNDFFCLSPFKFALDFYPPLFKLFVLLNLTN